MKKIKGNINKKSPISIKVDEEIIDNKKILGEIEGKLRLFNKDDIPPDSFNRFIALGEIKAKLELFEDKSLYTDYSEEIINIEGEIEELSIGLTSHENKKSSIITWLEELIQEYLDKSSNALDNYAGYKATFNYSDKSLKLREPKTPNIINTVGSSSNNLFLHICLFLGLHDLLLQVKSPYVPNFLFLDQPSRPYYDDGKLKDNQEIIGTDRDKISIAFKVLDYFMKTILERKNSFQMIIVEHIPPEIWEKQGLSNINLVEEFRNGNYLINEVNKTKHM